MSIETILLGIPTVTDRLLQQAVLQVITARFEYGFSGFSLGFRLNRSVQQAVQKAQGCINEGFQYIVDILKKRGYVPLLELYNQIKPGTVLFPMT